MILTRSTRLSQPQGPVELDYTNPLVRGVVVAWVPGASKNLVGGRPASVDGVVQPGGIGLVQATAGTQSAFLVPDSPDQRTGNFTSFAILRRVGTLPANFDGVGKNWQGNTDPTYVSDAIAYNPSGAGQNSIRVVFGQAGSSTTTTSYSDQETTEWHSIASTHDGSTGSLYVSGVLRASVAVQPAVYGASGDNSFGVNTSGKSGSMEYALVLRWNRALSAGEIASIEANPWQLFRPVQRRVYFDMGAGGGAAHIVTADPVDQGSTTTRPGLTQTHVTTASAVAQGATVSRPAITQTHVVTARAVAQGSTVNAPAVEVGSITVVTARPVVQSSTVNAPSIVQTHIVTARPAAQGGAVTRPGLTQTHTVTARAVAQGSVVNAPSVDVGSTPATFVTARPVAQGSTVNAPGIRQTHVTSARAAVQGSTINAPGLVQTHVVTARPVVQASTARVAGIAPPLVRSIYWASVPSEKFSAAVPSEKFSAAVPSEKFSAAVPGGNQ